MRLRIALMLVAAPALFGCTGEERHDYEAAAEAIDAERNNIVECHDCPLNVGNAVLMPLS